MGRRGPVCLWDFFHPPIIFCLSEMVYVYIPYRYSHASVKYNIEIIIWEMIVTWITKRLLHCSFVEFCFTQSDAEPMPSYSRNIGNSFYTSFNKL
jgi:hypothetical protein